MLHCIKTIFSKLTKAEKYVLLVFSVIFIISAATLLGITVRNHTVAVAANGGEIRIGAVGQPTHINPVLASNSVDKLMMPILFSSAYDTAEKIEPDKTDRIWKMRIKEGLVWSDGEKLTSDDIIFTIKKIQDPESKSPYFLSWQGITANRLSELEVQFNLVNKYPFFPEYLKHLYIAPKHIFADVPSSNWRLSEYNLKPIGNGPYAFESYKKLDNGFITLYSLKPNPTYFGKHPFIKNLIIRFYKQKKDLINDFNSGAIDGFATFDTNGITSISRTHKTISFSVPTYYAVFLNQAQNIALKEQPVRKALSLAVDRKDLINSVLNGNGSIAAGPLFYISNPKEEFSLDKAKEALENDGWLIDEKSGIRKKTIKGNDILLKFNLITPKIPFLMNTADKLKNYWAKIGIKTHIDTKGINDIIKNIIPNRDYESILFGNTLNPVEDIYPFWHSNERFYPGLNLSLYNNKEADKLIEDIRTNPDKNARMGQINKLKDIISNDCPAVFLYSPRYLYISSKEIKGIKPEKLSAQEDIFKQINNWYIKTARKIK